MPKKKVVYNTELKDEKKKKEITATHLSPNLKQFIGHNKYE